MCYTGLIEVEGGASDVSQARKVSPYEAAMKRAFTSLSPREALRIAIVIEERNAQIYQRLAEMFGKSCPESPQIPSAFHDLANMERKHGMLLTKSYGERFGAVRTNLTEDDIWDFIETPRLAVADILTAVEAGDARGARRMALQMALGAEEDAVNYYARVAETTLDPELKALCEEFVAFEQEHTSWVEKELGQPDTGSGPAAATG
jgi:rubrerythrin